jgi:hypothetical protein
LILRLRSGQVLQCGEEEEMDVSPIFQRVFQLLGRIVVQVVLLFVGAMTLKAQATSFA